MSYSQWSSSWKYYKDYNFRTNSIYKSQDPNKHKYGIWNHDDVLDLTKKELGQADLMVFLGYDEKRF